MSFFARGDKFTVAVANSIKKLWYGDVSAMEDGECRVKLEDGDFVLKIMDGAIEKYVERSRSQERVYHGVDVIDENSDIIFLFNVFSGATTVKLKLLGLNFPEFHYTELPAHDHGGQTFAAPDHIHTQAAHDHHVDITGTSSSGGNHNHSFSGSSGNTAFETVYQGDAGSANHRHSFTPSGTISTEVAHTHTVRIHDDTDQATPAIAACADADALASAGITGAGLNDTKKTTVDDLIKVYVAVSPAAWGTAKTKATAGWESLANINAATGTDEIEIISLVTDGGFNYIKINEPTAKKGGKIAWHISVN